MHPELTPPGDVASPLFEFSSLCDEDTCGALSADVFCYVCSKTPG